MKNFLGATALFALVSQTLGTFWLDSMTHQGLAAFNAAGSSYPVYRNVMNYGAKGDGVTDDTAAINAAINAGSRCPMGTCESATTSPAVVFFPAGTYLVSSPILPSYMTQLIGDPTSLPTLKCTVGFFGAQNLNGIIDADPYTNTGSQSYASVNVFYRQIRNFIIDTTNAPATDTSQPTGIHWPTAQATSLQNIVFKLSTASGNNHRGIFVENGSGGFMTDLVFNGGYQGMDIGSQQFTTRNLTFNNCQTAIYQIWNWSWTYMGLNINNCQIGVDLSDPAGTVGSLNVGSMTVIDSTISNTPVGFLTGRTTTSTPITGGSLALENIVFTNVPSAIKGASSVILAGTTGTMTLAAWISGNVYNPTGPTVAQASTTSFPRPAGLLSGTNYYYRSKPQYQNLAASSFSSVRTGGAKGDGVTDDTTALQAVITAAAAAGKVVFFDYGIYKITNVLYIPPGSKIVGESYPTIMGAGSLYQDINNPFPVVRVGSTAGETGVVEWSDMIISTYGAAPGATLVQWNLASPVGTPSGVWDVHTRVGGFTGSALQVAQCPKTAENAACYAAWLSWRITNIGSGVYMENVWLWTADHDIDDASDTQINVFSGRGLSVESTVGNIWLIGTAVEHHTLYQYQFASTKNIMMGFIQTESPYFQPAIPAGSPYTVVSGRNDPDFTNYCSGKAATCYFAWGLRILDSTDILIYGAGLYSWFDNYDDLCSTNNGTYYNEYCQTQIFAIDEGSSTSYSGSTVWAYALNTIGSISMIDLLGTSIAKYTSNTDTYAQTIIQFIS